MPAARSIIETRLARAGVRIDGSRPWDLRVHDDRFFLRLLATGSLGLGESYVDGWWDAEALDELTDRVLRAGVDADFRARPGDCLHALAARLFNPQSLRRSRTAVRRHYDLGNDLYAAMLDRRLVYSCGRWEHAATLDEAQEAKLDLVCRKIGLSRGDRVLDVGCGWGSWAGFAAERYGARVTGITLSEPQAELGRVRCAGLPVTLLVRDYREMDGRFDHVVSIGMFEHVGARNYRRFMEAVRGRLADDGLFLLHTIGGNRSVPGTDPWIERHVFPGSHIPSAREIADAVEGLFVVEDWQNFGADYDRTLMDWWRNFEARWPDLRGRYDERFHRAWRYYLLTCAGSFRARRNHVWQIVLSGNGVPGGYSAERHASFAPSDGSELREDRVRTA